MYKEMSKHKENKIKDLENKIELLNEYKDAILKLYVEFEDVDPLEDEYDELHNNIEKVKDKIIYYKDYVLPYEEEDLDVIVDFDFDF